MFSPLERTRPPLIAVSKWAGAHMVGADSQTAPIDTDPKTEKPRGLLVWRREMWVWGMVAILEGGGRNGRRAITHALRVLSVTRGMCSKGPQFLLSGPTSNPVPSEFGEVSEPTCHNGGHNPSVSFSNLKISCFQKSTSPLKPCLITALLCVPLRGNRARSS